MGDEGVLSPVKRPRVVVTPRPAAGPARRRYRYWRKHTPHYYLVLTALPCALVVCILNAIAFFSRGILMAELAFYATLATTLIILVTFFWGFCLVLTIEVPVHRMKYLIPHAAVGLLSPLVYSLNISFIVDTVGSQPVNAGVLVTSCLCLALLLLQFSMGKGVVYNKPLYLIPGGRHLGVDRTTQNKKA
ncbi:MAG: DUF2231 domain-containing protein [Chloroflexota bacterium]|nr:DUF2231 domain-containing protein [Chloroflexota bacterium]